MTQQVRIVIQYFDGCPNWETTELHLLRLVNEGLLADIGYELIDSHEQAVARGFRGSPTVLVNGVDPFGDDPAPVGLACRVYETEKGPAGSPTLAQLRDAIDMARR